MYLKKPELDQRVNSSCKISEPLSGRRVPRSGKVGKQVDDTVPHTDGADAFMKYKPDDSGSPL